MSFVRHPTYFLSKAVLASDLLFWLFWMPIGLRIHTFHILLQRLTRSERHKRKIPLKDAVGMVTRICNLGPFRSRIFPKRCLRQSLTLYRTLSQMGYPVEIHFGIHKNGEDLQGHSWATMHGEHLADAARSGMFKVVYSYPYNTLSSGGMEIERSTQANHE